MPTKSKKDKPKEYSNELLSSRDLAFTYWGTMNYFTNLIKSSELKAGLILSFYGILFNFVYQHIEEAKAVFENHWWLYLIAIAWLGFTLTSMFFSVRSFIPRIMKEYEPNVFFFGDIISKFGSINEYSKLFLETNVDKNKLYDQLGQQIYINARITAAKFKNVNKSIKYLIYSLITLITFIILQIVITLF